MGGRATTFILTVFTDDHWIRRGKATKSRCHARNVTLNRHYSTRPAVELHRRVAPCIAGRLPIEATLGLNASLHPAALAHDSSSLAFHFGARLCLSAAAAAAEAPAVPPSPLPMPARTASRLLHHSSLVVIPPHHHTAFLALSSR